MLTPTRVDKVWGYELCFANDRDRNYCGKMLVFNEGYQTSIHRHLIKDEVFFILDGTFTVWLGTDPQQLQEHRLVPGDRLHIPVGTWHRIAAGVGAHRLIEASTYHSDDDVERFELSGPVHPVVSFEPPQVA